MSAVMRLRALARRLAFRTPLRARLVHRYPYLFSPAQLRVILNAVDQSLREPGALIEIGCAWGLTTVFLNEHLRTTNNADRAYIAIDTFGGFTRRDVDYEITERRKAPAIRTFDDTFRNNSREAVAATLAANGFRGARLIEADVVTYDLAPLGPIAFALIDVDLLLPVRSSLDKVWPQLSPGGMIVVDDCAPNNEWDGALEAYEDFVSRMGLESNIVEHKLGLICKDRK